MFKQLAAEEKSESIKNCLIFAKRNTDVFKNAKRQGKRCRDSAAWIGLER
jgi:hypothetical protein